MGESTYSLFQRGRRHLRAGMAAQATVALEKAKRREPDKASIREALGIAYFRIRRWSEAEAEFRKVLELSPVNDYAHYALGRCLEKQGRDARGERALQARELARSGLGASTARASASSTSVRRMRAVVQRVARARVTPGGEIGNGLCVLLGVAGGDGEEQAARLAGKVARLRIFPDDDGRFDRSVEDVAGSVLVVSQFTLIADTAKGNRPDFARGRADGGGRAALRAVLLWSCACSASRSRPARPARSSEQNRSLRRLGLLGGAGSRSSAGCPSPCPQSA